MESQGCANGEAAETNWVFVEPASQSLTKVLDAKGSLKPNQTIAQPAAQLVYVEVVETIRLVVKSASRSYRAAQDREATGTCRTMEPAIGCRLLPMLLREPEKLLKAIGH